MTRRLAVEKDAFDPSAIIQRAIDSELDASIFNAIDESVIPKAKNWLDWCIGKEFLNMDPQPFPRQMQMALSLFGEYCPRCSDREFIQKDGLGLDGLFNQNIADIREKLEILEYGVCPKCKATQTEMYNSGELVFFQALNVCAGRRASKTTFASMCYSYQTHRFLCLPSPSKFFRVLQNQSMHMMFIAVTAEQAEDTLWQGFKDRIDSSVWFPAYHKFLDDAQKKAGVEIYKYLPTILSYNHKRLFAYFMAPDLRTLRGRTAFGTGIDEIALFDANASKEKVRANADETQAASASSLSTIRKAADLLVKAGVNWVPTAIDLNLSSPWTANDKIMELLRNSNRLTRQVGYHYPTWEMNPNISFDSLEPERQSDPKTFWREYGAVPSLGGDNAYLSEENLVQRCVIDKKVPYISHVNRSYKDPASRAEKPVALQYAEMIVKNRQRTRPMVLTVDTGHTNNSFSLCIASYNTLARAVSIDGVIECTPGKDQQGNASRVSFPDIYEKAIVPIIKNFNIRYVLYDRWNSVEQVQRIRRDHRIQAEQYSLTWDDFTALKSVIYDGRVHLPPPEQPISSLLKATIQMKDVLKSSPYLHLLYQMLTVRELGRRVVKPVNGTDDLFRAMALAVHRITDPQYTSEFYFNEDDGGFPKPPGVGVARLSRDPNLSYREPMRKAGTSDSVSGIRLNRSSQRRGIGVRR